MDVQTVCLTGIIVLAPLLLYGLFLKVTDGLYWSFFFTLLYRNNREAERQIGQRICRFIWKYLPPFFIAFLVIYLLNRFAGLF